MRVVHWKICRWEYVCVMSCLSSNFETLVDHMVYERHKTMIPWVSTSITHFQTRIEKEMQGEYVYFGERCRTCRVGLPKYHFNTHTWWNLAPQSHHTISHGPRRRLMGYVSGVVSSVDLSLLLSRSGMNLPRMLTSLIVNHDDVETNLTLGPPPTDWWKTQHVRSQERPTSDDPGLRTLWITLCTWVLEAENPTSLHLQTRTQWHVEHRYRHLSVYHLVSRGHGKTCVCWTVATRLSSDPLPFTRTKSSRSSSGGGSCGFFLGGVSGFIVDGNTRRHGPWSHESSCVHFHVASSEWQTIQIEVFMFCIVSFFISSLCSGGFTVCDRRHDRDTTLYV